MKENSQDTTGDIVSLIDNWYDIQQRRLELQRRADELGDEENSIKKKFIILMKERNILKLQATKCALEVKQGDPTPTVHNWELFYGYVLENKAFELLQKRLSSPAIREHWEAGEVIPGVQKFPVDRVVITRP
jgi:hypothetical protein